MRDWHCQWQSLAARERLSEPRLVISLTGNLVKPLVLVLRWVEIWNKAFVHVAVGQETASLFSCSTYAPSSGASVAVDRTTGPKHVFWEHPGADSRDHACTPAREPLRGPSCQGTLAEGPTAKVFDARIQC